MKVSVQDFQRLNDKIKLFGISPTEEEEFALLDIWDNLNKLFPKKANVAINFYRQGKGYRAEALVGINHQCFISRKESDCLVDLSLILKNDIVRKMGRNNSSHGFGGVPQALAI